MTDQKISFCTLNTVFDKIYLSFYMVVIVTSPFFKSLAALIISENPKILSI